MKGVWIPIILTVVAFFVIYATFYLDWNIHGYKRIENLPHSYTTKEFKMPSNCTKLRQLKTVLLAVNYNFPHYSSIPLLKKTYSGIFGHMVFCGSSRHPGVMKIRGTKGYLGYDCLATAIRKYPHFIGYLQINDDVILNWWNLWNFDLSKIWTSSRISYKEKSGNYIFGKEIPAWHWWRGETQAAIRCETAFNQTVHLNNTAEGKRLNLPAYLKNYLINTDNIYMCVNGWSDVFYIPQQFARIYSNLSDIYRDNKVFLEVAVPSILLFFLNRTNLMNLDGVFYVNSYGYSKKYYSGEAFYEIYSFESTFTHPFKLGGKMKAANRNFLENVFSTHGYIIQRYCLI